MTRYGVSLFRFRASVRGPPPGNEKENLFNTKAIRCATGAVLRHLALGGPAEARSAARETQPYISGEKPIGCC